MPNQWFTRDLIRLVCDCELGTRGTVLHVVATDGPYMTVRDSSGVFQHTGRDYDFAVKCGDGAVNLADVPPEIVARDERVRDNIRREVVDMRDRNGNVLAGNPQLDEVVARLVRVVREGYDR